MSDLTTTLITIAVIWSVVSVLLAWGVAWTFWGQHKPKERDHGRRDDTRA